MALDGKASSGILEPQPRSEEESAEPGIEDLIGERKPARKGWRWGVALIAAGVAVSGALVWRNAASAAPPGYATAAVGRRTIARTIRATGSLQALTTVQVGTQVSGTVAELYADFNSRVNKGTDNRPPRSVPASGATGAGQTRRG